MLYVCFNNCFLFQSVFSASDIRNEFQTNLIERIKNKLKKKKK